MSVLLQQRCVQHPTREAAAKCPICARFFCRECVTEQDGRMACTGCVAATQKPIDRGRSSMILLAMGSGGGLLLAWLVFYYAGMWLAQVPDSFYRGPR